MTAIDSTMVQCPSSINVAALAPLTPTDRPKYQVCRFSLPNVANAAGSGAGAAVTTAITVTAPPQGPGNGLPANGNYTVAVTPSQACFVSITGKTTTGFNVVLTPMTTGTTLSAGTFDVSVSYTF